MIDGEGSIEEGIGEIEDYINQYTPEKSQTFANKVEAYANNELPPAFDHSGLDFISPLSDNVLETIRNRIGAESSAITFVDLQQIVTNELTDIEDQQTQITGEAYKKSGVMTKRLKFIEEAALKVVSDEELDTYDKKAIRWYLSHNIDRWNEKSHKENDPANSASQNESYFASLYEKFENKPLVRSKNENVLIDESNGNSEGNN